MRNKILTRGILLLNRNRESWGAKNKIESPDTTKVVKVEVPFGKFVIFGVISQP